MEDKRNIDAGKHVLAVFLTRNYFERIIRPSASVDNTLLDLLNSSYPTKLLNNA